MSLINFEQNADNIPPLSKCHLGTVVANNDPKNLCRIKVAIPGILDEKTNVWAMRVAPSFPGVTYAVPDVGQRVRVWFLLNDPQRPIYGLDYTHTDSKLGIFKPGEYGYSDTYGNYLKCTKDSNLTVKYSSIILDSADVMVKGSLGATTGVTGVYTLHDGTVLQFKNGLLVGAN